MRKDTLNKFLAVLQCILILFQFNASGEEERSFSKASSSQDVKITCAVNNLLNTYYDNSQQKVNKSNNEQGNSSFSFYKIIDDSYPGNFFVSYFNFDKDILPTQRYLLSSDLKSPPVEFL